MRIRIRDPESLTLDPGSGIRDGKNIPDPQHCIQDVTKT
jgi:hypothetical protein